MRYYKQTIAAALALILCVCAGVALESTRLATEQPEPVKLSDQELQSVIRAIQSISAAPEPTATTELIETTEPTYQSMVWSRDFDGEDSWRLMKIAMAEAEGESVEGKALVMLVVLNRVWSDQFPDTIEEVIFQENQFSPVREGGRWYTTVPNAECAKALELVMDGWDGSQGALYFESTGKDGWHSQNLELLFEYGGHKFYR